MNKFNFVKKEPVLQKTTASFLREIGVDPIVREGFFGGSRAICDPPPTDTDCDIVLLVYDNELFWEDLGTQWVSPEHDYQGPTDSFVTFRAGEYNLMVFDDPTEYGAVKGATALAKKLNIQDKEKRYRLFETVRSPWR